MPERNPISLVTKGTLAIRDIDLLAQLSRKAGCTVCFSITTLDDTLKRRLEPGTPPPLKRLQAMESLVLAGVNAGVLLAPIVPGITDSLKNLTEVVRGAAAHRARFLHSNVLFLKEGTKQHFFSFLGREYPRLLSPYKRLYASAYVPGRFKEGLQSEVEGLKQLHGLSMRDRTLESPLADRQLQLAL